MKRALATFDKGGNWTPKVKWQTTQINKWYNLDENTVLLNFSPEILKLIISQIVIESHVHSHPFSPRPGEKSSATSYYPNTTVIILHLYFHNYTIIILKALITDLRTTELQFNYRISCLLTLCFCNVTSKWFLRTNFWCFILC
jgi:hypothetical protein